MHQVDSWLTANKLTLNIEKTKVITFKTRNSPPVLTNLEIKLNGNALDKVTSIRFLGVTIHEHLTWKSHMELLLKKIRMGRGIIQKVKPYLNQKSLQLLYYSMIQSYSISSWCFNNKTLIYRLQNTTNKVIRLAFNAKKDDITALMKKHNIFFFIIYLPYLSSIHEKANCIAMFWTVSPHSLGSCHFRVTCLPHKRWGVPFSALPKDTTSELAGLFSTTSHKCRAPSREAVDTIFKSLWYDSIRE